MEERKILIDVISLFRKVFGISDKKIKSFDEIYDLWMKNQDFFKEKEYPAFLAKNYNYDKRRVPFEVFYSFYLMSEFLKDIGVDIQKASRAPLRLVANSG